MRKMFSIRSSQLAACGTAAVGILVSGVGPGVARSEDPSAPVAVSSPTVELFLAVNRRNEHNLIAVWQQNRWSNAAGGGEADGGERQ
jgi:hypothetical protein